MSGDNNEELIAAQKRIDDLEKANLEKEEALAKEKKMNADAQDQINKQSKEIGDHRKNFSALEESVEEIKKKILDPTSEAPKKDEGTKAAEGIEKKELEAKRAEAKAEVDRLQGLVSEEDEKVLTEKFNECSPDLQEKITTDPEYKKRFLENQLGEKAVPKPTWGKKPEEKSDNGSKDIDKELDTLFKTKKEERNFVPSGSNGAGNAPNGERKTIEPPKKPKFEPGSNAEMLYSNKSVDVPGVKQGSIVNHV